MDEATKLPIGPEEVAEAAQILQRYKAGKAALDKRLVDNELWFRMGHWKNYQNPMMEGKPQPSSGWLFNSIANKHADAMDNYPSPNVLPRAEDDEAAAQALSSVLPVVLEQADYEQVYSDTWWRKLKQGTGVKGVFWDSEQRGGVGEITIRPMNLLMLYWEPGVDDIQASPHFFSLSLADTAQLESRWPQLAGHAASVLDVPHYIHDGGLDTSDKSVVVDWYYKKLSPEGRSVLHYCKFCNGVVLYASENDPALAERGFYDHGKYPFVFDALFMEEDSPAGFGYIDVMKECQTAIDKMNHAMDENVLLSSRQRYVLSDTAGVNEEELTDLSRDIIHVVGRLNDDSFRPLQTAGLQGNSLSYRKVSTALDPARLRNVKSALGGALDGRYYLHLVRGSGEAQAVRLLVYDTERGLWQEEDVCSYEMAGSGGQLYLWDGKAIWAADADREENWQQAGGIEDGVSFELVSGDIGLDSPEELYLSRLTLRLEAEVKSRIEVAVSYDSGAWETLAQLTADGRRCFDVPFVPRRCGSLRFRLKGRGQLTLRSLTRTSAAAKGGILAQEVN